MIKQSATTTLLVLVTCASALGVGTSHWSQTSEADFKAGKFDNVVATNLGDLKLSRATRTLLGQDPRVSAVYALAEAPDGSIYAATGPQGVLLRVNRDGAVETAATVADNVSLFCAIVDRDGRVLVGTAGARGQIYRVEKPGAAPVSIFSADGVQYIWALAQTPDGNLYAATGPNGQLFEIKPDGSSRVLFDSDENNLLSLVSDGKDLLYAGTDPNGHVYRVNRKSGEMFVVYDAPETEVTALAIDAKGNLFAGTGQSTGGPAAAVEAPAATGATGRPELDQPRETPIPSEPPGSPEPPKPPEMPLPGPNDPPAIPKDPAAPTTRRADARDASNPYVPRYLSAAALQPVPGEPPGDPGEPPPPPGRKPGKPPVSVAAGQAQLQPAGVISEHKAGEPAAGGNGIYRIDPHGFVTEVFRQNVLVLSLVVEPRGVLLVGTGSEGMVYQINPAADETVVIAKVDPKEILTVLPARDGKIYMGMANEGQVATMSSGYATRGTFTSPVLDATQISRFGKIRLRGTLPGGTSLTVSTRSGNVEETADAAGWSKWTDEVPAAEFLPITSPPARFLQYRLTFNGSNEGRDTPVVDEVAVAYQTPNLPPRVKSVNVGAGAGVAGAGGEASAEVVPQPSAPAPSTTTTISWEAEDPNTDTVRYALYYRAAPRGEWILLKDKLDEATYEWNTRTVADGRYEVKVVASDEAANPAGEGRTGSRVSDPVVVDNTPPAIGDLRVIPGSDRAHVRARAVDRTGTVASLEYAVDSHDDWQAVLPADKIADSPDEAYDFAIERLSPGAHQITLRATDSRGNRAFETVAVKVGA
jgi:hypothetical protein